MSLDPVTGALVWTPNFTQAGTYHVTVQVSDDASNPLRDQATFSIVVQDSSGPAVNQFNLSITNGRVTEVALVSVYRPS
jgi:Putative Ig domain